MHVFILLVLAILPFCLCGPRGRWGWGSAWLVAILAFFVLASPYPVAGGLGTFLLLAAPVVGLICWACTGDLAEPEKPRRRQPW